MKDATKLLLLFSLLLLCADAHAANTRETWSDGAFQFEHYIHFDGIGLGKHEKTIGSDMVFGYGLMEKFSGFAVFSGSADEYFGDGSAAMTIGIAGNPVNTDHVDLDLVLTGSMSAGAYNITPGLELNFDLKPNLELWGVYLIIEEVLTGTNTEKGLDCTATRNAQTNATDVACTQSETVQPVFSPKTNFLIGTYWTVAKGHQLLVDFKSTIHNNPQSGANTFEIGAVSLGYNVMVADTVELINGISVDIPQSGEKVNLGISIGFQFGIPGS